MPGTIGDVVELIGPNRAVGFLGGQFAGQAFRDVDIVVRILVGHRRHLTQIGAAEPEHVFLLLALGFRDDDDRPIAARIADEGEADAGVAGRALDDDAARAQQAFFFCILDDGERRAVLHRSAGVQELGLAQNATARGARGGLQFDEWRVADTADESAANLHGGEIIDRSHRGKGRQVPGETAAVSGRGSPAPARRYRRSRRTMRRRRRENDSSP